MQLQFLGKRVISSSVHQTKASVKQKADGLSMVLIESISDTENVFLLNLNLFLSRFVRINFTKIFRSFQLIVKNYFFFL